MKSKLIAVLAFLIIIISEIPAMAYNPAYLEPSTWQGNKDVITEEINVSSATGKLTGNLFYYCENGSLYLYLSAKENTLQYDDSVVTIDYKVNNDLGQFDFSVDENGISEENDYIESNFYACSNFTTYSNKKYGDYVVALDLNNKIDNTVDVFATLNGKRYAIKSDIVVPSTIVTTTKAPKTSKTKVINTTKKSNKTTKFSGDVKSKGSSKAQKFAGGVGPTKANFNNVTNNANIATTSVNSNVSVNQIVESKQKLSKKSLITLIISIIVAVIGFILIILGMILSKKENIKTEEKDEETPIDPVDPFDF